MPCYLDRFDLCFLSRHVLMFALLSECAMFFHTTAPTMVNQITCTLEGLSGLLLAGEELGDGAKALSFLKIKTSIITYM